MSLDNVVIDIRELNKGMDLTRREYEARKDRDPPLILKDFLTNSEDKMKKLETDVKSAQVRPPENAFRQRCSFIINSVKCMIAIFAQMFSFFLSQESYKVTVEFFGENPKTLAPNTFFSLFVRFVKGFKVNSQGYLLENGVQIVQHETCNIFTPYIYFIQAIFFSISL